MLHRLPPLVCTAMLLSVSAQGAVIILDDFESGEGHFNLAPSFSGTTQGEMDTPNPQTSTADLSTDFALGGLNSEKIFLDDDPGVTSIDGNAWRLRFLSGGGTIANNTPIAVFQDGYVGFFVLTTTPNLRVGIMVDDGVTGHLERSILYSIPADGQWHLFQWRLQDETQWDAFAGTGANGVIDSTGTVTIDSLYFDAPLDPAQPDQDAVIYVDNVSASDSGPIPVPEPSAAALLLTGALGTGLFGRRRRAQK